MTPDNIKAKGDEIVSGYLRVFSKFELTEKNAIERAINFVNSKIKRHWKNSDYWNEVLNYLKSKL